MAKKYILTKEQYNTLIENKKQEKKLLNNILEEINRVKKGLNESTIKSDAVSDIIRKHHRKGNLTKYVISGLSEKGIKIS